MDQIRPCSVILEDICKNKNIADFSVISHKKYQQNLTSENNKKQCEENWRRGNNDPLALQNPVKICFGSIKKEEKDIKKEDSSLNERNMSKKVDQYIKKEGLSPNDSADLQYMSTDDECENDSNTRFTSSSNYNETCPLQSHTNLLDTDGKEYECQVCHRKFSKSHYLKQHSVVHVKEKVPEDLGQQTLPIVQHEEQQNICNKIVDVPNEKMNIQKKDKIFTCRICNLSYAQHHMLKSHIKAIHLIRGGGYKCSKCDSKKFSTFKRLTAHNTALHCVKMYECTVCNKKFSFLSYLKKHSVIHTTEGKYECEDCSQKFNFIFQLENHITFRCKKNLSRRGKNEKYYFCGICGMKYTTLGNVKGHIKVIHLGNTDYKCEQCNKTFKHSNDLKRHNNSNGHKNFNKFECDYCKKKFSHIAYLKQHIGVHDRTKKYVCGDCGKSYYTHGLLKAHIDVSHLKNKDYQCEYCGKTFVLKSSLDQHINIVHKKLREFECNICNKKFQAQHHLQNHIICVHEKVKNFVCEQCGDRFLLAHHLRNHITAIHKGIERSVLE